MTASSSPCSRSLRPRRAAAVLAAVAGLGGGTGCVGLMPQPADATRADSEWVSGASDLRKSTALVRVTPPARLKESLESIAARQDDEDVADFLRGAAAGGFGSGFLVVHRDASGAAAFVVTNRHVVAGSDEVEVTFGDGTTYKNAEVVYTSPTEDLAVVALPESSVRSFGSGLRPAASAPIERHTVVATGYPGIAGRPSFQMTEGKVSNARFAMPEIGVESPLVQHTAAIDPGSSGGPLTNEQGEVVGVNVMLLRSRNAAFFAVPSSAIVEGVRRAHRLAVDRRTPAFLAKELDGTCAAFAADTSSPTAGAARLKTYISNQLVASAGLQSYVMLASSPLGPMVRRAFFEDPVAAMRLGIVARFVAGVERKAGSLSVTCGAANAGDLARALDGGTVRMPLRTVQGDVEVTWRFEQGTWRVVGFVVPEVIAPSDRPSTNPPVPGKKMTKTLSPAFVKQGK